MTANSTAPATPIADALKTDLASLQHGSLFAQRDAAVRLMAKIIVSVGVLERRIQQLEDLRQ